MNERMKVLEMLKDGKITVEQAEALLATIEPKSENPGNQSAFRPFAGFKDKIPLDELKNLGTQITNAVSQSLSEVKKSVESFSFGPSNALFAEHSLTLPESVRSLTAETVNGSIQAVVWDEPYIKIRVRGYVKTNSLAEAKQALQESIQLLNQDTSAQCTVIQNSHSHVVSAHFDIFIPASATRIQLKTQNGKVHVDGLAVEDLQLDTQNGGIWVVKTEVERLHLTSENGAIEIQSSVRSLTKNLYARTRNGRVTVEGIAEDAQLSGTLRTTHGRIEVMSPRLQLDWEDDRRTARIRSSTLGNDGSSSANSAGTTVYCESKHGGVRIRE